MRSWRWVVPLVCLLAGFLLATTRESAREGELRPTGTTRLSDLVRTAQTDVDRAEARRRTLLTAVDDAQDTVASSDAGVAAQLDTSEGLAAVAGLTEVDGPGLRVTLTDAKRAADGTYPEGVAPDDLIVHQQDLQSVLNGLWAGGAEAVAVQDQRVVMTSAPRCIGNVLLLHGRTYSPPYVITAVGDPDELRASLDAERGVAIYRQYVRRYGLGYEVEGADEMSMAAYTGSIRLSEATARTGESTPR